MAHLLRLTVVALMLVLWMGPHTVAHADQSVDLSALHPQPSDLFEPGGDYQLDLSGDREMSLPSVLPWQAHSAVLGRRLGNGSSGRAEVV